MSMRVSLRYIRYIVAAFLSEVLDSMLQLPELSIRDIPGI